MEMAAIASPSVAAVVGPCREQAPQSSIVGSSKALLGLARTRCLGAQMTTKGTTAMSRVPASASSKGNKFGNLQGSNDRREAQGVVRVQTESSNTVTAQQKTSYYYLIANAKFMLDDEEHFQEQMQEKLRLYGERNKEQDFWIVIEPRFLEEHPEVAKRVNRPAVALVSTDKVWITFMKLRLDRVLKGEIEVDSPKDALTGNLTTVKFERPEKWIAPYPKYEGEWWTPFLYKET